MGLFKAETHTTYWYWYTDFGMVWFIRVIVSIICLSLFDLSFNENPSFYMFEQEIGHCEIFTKSDIHPYLTLSCRSPHIDTGWYGNWNAAPTGNLLFPKLGWPCSPGLSDDTVRLCIPIIAWFKWWYCSALYAYVRLI